MEINYFTRNADLPRGRLSYIFFFPRIRAAFAAAALYFFFGFFPVFFFRFKKNRTTTIHNVSRYLTPARQPE